MRRRWAFVALIGGGFFFGGAALLYAAAYVLAIYADWLMEVLS